MSINIYLFILGDHNSMSCGNIKWKKKPSILISKIEDAKDPFNYTDNYFSFNFLVHFEIVWALESLNKKMEKIEDVITTTYKIKFVLPFSYEKMFMGMFLPKNIKHVISNMKRAELLAKINRMKEVDEIIEYVSNNLISYCEDIGYLKDYIKIIKRKLTSRLEIEKCYRDQTCI